MDSKLNTLNSNITSIQTILVGKIDKNEYLLKTGCTLIGKLNGTTATFSGITHGLTPAAASDTTDLATTVPVVEEMIF